MTNAYETRPVDTWFKEAQIRCKNFSGRPNPFSGKEERQFCLVLNPMEADELEAAGWPVNTFKSNPDFDPDREPEKFIKVTVRPKNQYDAKGNVTGVTYPEINLVTNYGTPQQESVPLSMDELSMLDRIPIDHVTVLVHPNRWVNKITGKEAYKAIVDTMYVVAGRQYSNRILENREIAEMYKSASPILEEEALPFD